MVTNKSERCKGGHAIIIKCFLVGFMSLLILLTTLAVILERASGTAMGDLSCLPHLPLSPTMWSTLRASVSLHANGDGPGRDAIIIQNNSLFQFARTVGNSLRVSHRKCDKFMNGQASLFSSPQHPGHYKIDIVVCILDEMGVSISAGQWVQVKEFLRTTACRRVRLDIESDTNTFSRSRSRSSLPSSSTNLSGDAASTEYDLSSTTSQTEVLTLRALVNQLQSRNTMLESVLEAKAQKVGTLQKEKRLLQQQVRRIKKSNENLTVQVTNAQDDSMANNFSLARVKSKNPGKWSWLTPLGKINVAVACQHKTICIVRPCTQVHRPDIPFTYIHTHLSKEVGIPGCPCTF